MPTTRRALRAAVAATGALTLLLLSGCVAPPAPATSASPTTSAAASAPGCVADPQAAARRAPAADALEPLPAEEAAALDEAAAAAIASTQDPAVSTSTGAPGTIVAVRGPTGTWIQAYGIADLESGAPMTTELHHRIASVTKTFTGTLIAQLVAEGKLALDDPISDHVADVPRGDEITVRELITMRSGIRDYFDGFLAEWVGTSNVAYTPDQMLAVAYAEQPLFAPGSDFDYSNANYLLLGKVIESVTASTLAEQMQERIIEPLDLQGTSWPGDSAALPDPHGRGYSTVTVLDGAVASTPDGSLIDTTDYNPAWSGASGEMIGTAEDLLVYGRALGTGQGLLPETAQIERLSSFQPGWTPDSQYGDGLICRGGWVGHGGDTLGFHTDMYYNPDIDTTVVVMMNRYPSYQPQNVVTAIAAALGAPIAPLE